MTGAVVYQMEMKAYDTLLQQLAAEIQNEEQPLELESIENLLVTARKAKRLHEKVLALDAE